MRWLVVLDPLDGLLVKTDTSLAIIRTARARGIDVETATIDRLFFDTRARVVASDGAGNERVSDCADYHLIMMRKEPPYDLAFHYATQILSLAGTLVVNEPQALRDYNEKLITLPFVAHMPPTLVSSDTEVIMDFIGRHQSAVVKALDSFQGKAVRRVTPADRATVVEFTAGGTMPVQVQPFMEAVYGGDKRVMLAGNRVLGAALRRPKQGYHANFANSDALPTELTEREQRILSEVGPWLPAHGIHFTGLDFIGECLTEINITCPTGIMQISELEGRDLPREVVDYLAELAENHGSRDGRPVD